jgi:hypothetical protein
VENYVDNCNGAVDSSACEEAAKRDARRKPVPHGVKDVDKKALVHRDRTGASRPAALLVTETVWYSRPCVGGSLP